MSLKEEPQPRLVEETYAQAKARRERIEEQLGVTIPPWPHELQLKEREEAQRDRRAR